jgi:DNA-binding HxlR family transcriptional regulator
MDECRDEGRRLQGRHPVCPRFQRTAELLGRRWSAAVIRVALEGPVRFTEIRESVDGLSARLLTERLRELEAAGMIERRRDDATGAVVYGLTEKGRALSRILREIEAWVDDWDDRPVPRRAGGDA